MALGESQSHSVSNVSTQLHNTMHCVHTISPNSAMGDYLDPTWPQGTHKTTEPCTMLLDKTPNPTQPNMEPRNSQNYVTKPISTLPQKAPQALHNPVQYKPMEPPSQLSITHCHSLSPQEVPTGATNPQLKTQ